MNANRSVLLRTALRTIALSALPVAAHAQNIISVNFGANEPNGTISTASALTAGPVPIAGTFWNNMTGATQAAPQNLINDLGAASGASVTWSSANTWRSGSGGATATSLNGNLTKGYLDDGGAGPVISLNNIPFLSYNVYVIYGSDQAGGIENRNNNLRPVTINGTNFQGNNPAGTLSTATILGGANWTGKNWTNDDTLIEGNHFLRANNQAGLPLVVRGNNGQGGSGRGSISGIQIQNAYSGTTRYWDVDGSTPGAGGAAPAGTWDNAATNWNNAAGDGTAVAWTGANEAAVFSAGTGATGAYTVNVSDTQTTDAVILEEGNLTLAGGTINLVNAGVIRSFTTGGTLTIGSGITSAGSVSFDGAGSHVLNGTAAHTGGTNISSPFYLSPTGNISATSSVNVNNGVSAIVDGAITTTGAINLNGSSLLGEGTIIAGGNVNLNNIGTTNNLTLAGAGSLTASAGTLAINRGSVTFKGNAVVTLGSLNNPTAHITSSLNINDSAQINIANRMVLGDQVNAVMTVNQTGGSVTNTGTINNPGGDDMSNRWGHWGGGATTYNLSGGSLNLTGAPLYLSWDGPATLNISGTAVANIRGFNMGFNTRTNNSTINLNAGGTLNVGSDGIVSGGTANKFINLNGGTLGALADWSTVRPMTLTANTVVNTAGGNISLGGALTGTGNLTLQGGKTVVLGGVNTFTGTTTVTGNTTLLFGLLGNHGPVVTVEPGSTIGAGNLTVPGTGVAGNITAQNGSKSVFRISSGTSDLLDVLDLNIDTSHTLTVVPTGVIAANTVIPVIDYATLSGAGYAGVNVVSGNPRLSVSKEPDDGSAISIKVNSFDSVVWKGTDSTNPDLWDIDTTTNWQTDATLVATKFLQNDLVIFDDTATTTNVTLAGAIAPASVLFNHNTLNYSLGGSGIGGAGGLTKQGNGTLTLAGANTYSGGTTISAGALIASNTSGSATGYGAVTVERGGTLGGIGFIAGSVNVATGAKLSPGHGVGNLTVGGLEIDAGSQLDFEFAGSNDLITTGDVNIDGGSVALYHEGTNTPFATPGTYNLIAYTSLRGDPALLTVSNQQVGFSYNFGSNGTHVTLTIAFTQWPLSTLPTVNGIITGSGEYEPGTAATLTAVPNPGYRFTGWTGDASGTENPLTITMDANKTVGATFEKDLTDADSDGLSAYDELVVHGTDAALADSDGDGLSDGYELGIGRFSIVTGSFTWQLARDDARGKGGDLASFPTEDRWNRALQNLGADPFEEFTGLWIGASDAAVDGAWTWVNGEAFSFAPWGTGRPSSTVGNSLDFAEVSGGGGAEIGQWYDRSPTTVREGYLLETGYATNPLRADTDGDGLSDGQEASLLGSNPLLTDTDGDGITDANTDQDNDGLTAYEELVTYGTDPTLADTDGDGLSDGYELGIGRFSIITGSYTWQQARTDARSKGGDLASFPTEDRWNRALQGLGANPFDEFTGLWIGASDAAVDGSWTWVNGESFSFAPWGTSRPSSTSGNSLDFAEVSGGAGAEIGQWYDRSPTTVREGYILESGYATSPVLADTDGDGVSDGMEEPLGPITVPAAPTGLVATAIDGQIGIAFTAGSDGGAFVTNYQFSTDSGENWTVFSPAVTSSPVTITGLTNGTPYNIRLRAVNAVGAGAASDAVSATPMAEADIPTVFSASAKGGVATSISVSKLATRAASVFGSAVTVALVDAASEEGGTVVLAGSSIQYTPAVGFAGVDRFRVTFSSSGGDLVGLVEMTTTGTGSEPSPSSSLGVNPARLTPLSNGRIGIQFNGIPGVAYQLQRSTNLVSWTTVATITAGPRGEISYTDENPPSPSGFYRLSTP